MEGARGAYGPAEEKRGRDKQPEGLKGGGRCRKVSLQFLIAAGRRGIKIRCRREATKTRRLSRVVENGQGSEAEHRGD